jgi:outer membrane receptor protein involved in Fe transport
MKSRFTALVCALLLATTGVLAQGVITGALTGTVTTEGAPLPGATVTVTSPNLQGVRTSYTDANGNYNFVGLPPGDYTVSITLEGLAPVTRTTRVSLSGTARVDAAMQVSTVTEAITVTATAPAVLETTEVQANFQKEQIDALPVSKDVNAVANLAPGVTNNGPNGGMQISGAMSSDNLIMVNGATVQDNVRGTTRPLYIQDAIQETTVLSGAISAEFGRFTGGVVNTITKSGGNEFSGSFRDSLTNARWTAQSAAGETRPEDKISNIYEGTLGGRIIRDRLWFFAAGRRDNSTAPARFSTLLQSNTEIFSDRENPRYEVKLTGQITPRHSIIVNYLNNPLTFTNDVQIRAWEMAAVDPEAEQNEDFRAIHYNGILTNNLLAEVHASRRTFTFVGLGGDDADLYGGTPLRTSLGSTAINGIANAPWFCGICSNENRDAELATAKLTYFLGTKSLGTHNIVGGAERYTELLLSNNYQSASGLTVWIYGQTPTRDANGNLLFTWGPGDSVESFRVENPSLGSDLTTDSIFINDKWDLNQHFSFNIGGRFDKTDAVDQAGNPTADDTAFSPRLGVTYDPAGNGRLKLGATYGKYVGRLAEGVQGAGSNAGDPNWYGWYYEGDESFTGTAAQVVKHAIDWWQANGGHDLNLNPPTDLSIGGVSTQLAGKLTAPGMNEWTIGAGFQYRPTGYVRADYINRDWNNFYAGFTNLQTGRVELPGGIPADLTLIGNTDDFERTYRGIQLQASDRFFQRLIVGGSYTLSELKGNVEGETSGSGPVATGGWIFTYPEYQGFERNAPTGYLSGDQRHKLRAWVGYDIPLGAFGVVNASLLHRFDSGRPYSAVATITRAADPAAGDLSGKYISPPQTVSYFISDRGELRWDDVNRTDFALNYRIPVFGGSELFAEAEVFNLFNNQALINGDTSVITSRQTTLACHDAAGTAVRCAAFNPFTTTPVEGVNYALGPNFGKSTGLSSDYQLPRTYQFSLGLRF